MLFSIDFFKERHVEKFGQFRKSSEKSEKFEQFRTGWEKLGKNRKS